MVKINIPDVEVVGKVGEPTKVVFKGEVNKEVTLIIHKTCGCTKVDSNLTVEGNFEINVEYNARKFPAKVTKTINVYVMKSGVTIQTLTPKFTVDVK